ncbi:MAG: hypothetical protein RMJ44_01495 [Cytophagales bacterium]|nr:hypothetical protein [Bernardetiaceae bacterium]MDW8209735.1 hypothetical protein [Cytophagales bacterium]
MEIIFPPGITGYAPQELLQEKRHLLRFETICQEIPVELPSVSLQLFARASQGFGGNHDAAIFYKEVEEIIVLCNIFYPYIGFVSNGKYVNMPDFASFFAKEFTLIPAELLTTRLEAENPVSARAVCRLHREEFGQMSYRQPQIIGDIVFHRWR